MQRGRVSVQNDHSGISIQLFTRWWLRADGAAAPGNIGPEEAEQIIEEGRRFLSVPLRRPLVSDAPIGHG